MQISFNPYDPSDVSAMREILASVDGTAEPVVATAAPVAVNTVPAPLPAAPIVADPGPGPGPNPAVATETDIHGMTWDAAIHAGTKTKNTDGSWKVKKGQKDAAIAAIAAHKAAAVSGPNPMLMAPGAGAYDPATAAPGMPTAAPAPVLPAALPGMPTAAPAPVIPNPPITYDALVTRFVGMMQGNPPLISSDAAGEVYSTAGVTDVAALETNESLREAVWAQLDLIEAA